jgi:predicted ABC-type ATPase
MTAEEMAERGYDRTPEKGEVAQDVLGDAFDTHMLHRPEGDLSHLPAEMRYTDERMAEVHTPIVHALVDPHASQEAPHVLIVAGGPASGKSTFLKRAQGALPIPTDPVNLNADDIAFGEGPHHGIPEAADMLDGNDPYAALGSHREAGDIFEKAERAAIGKRANLVMDVTGNSDLREFQHQLERLRDNGYKVDMLYVSTPTETAVHNNIHRAETEGRYVPTPVVRDKHRRVVENYQSVSQLPWLNSVRVYDPEVGLVGFRNERGRMEATHEEGYSRWMSKANEEVPENMPAMRRRVEEAADKPPIVMYPFELESREKAHA